MVDCQFRISPKENSLYDVSNIMLHEYRVSQSQKVICLLFDFITPPYIGRIEYRSIVSQTSS